MTHLNLLNKKEQQEVLDKLKICFGVEKLNGTLIRIGTERIFLFQGEFSQQQLKKLEQAVPVERAGVYLGKIQHNQIRLSIEGSQLLQNQIKKNIFELNSEQAEQWMKGQELNIKSGKNGFIIMKYKDDFLGTGKASEEKISNFIPKNRRLKEKN